MPRISALHKAKKGDPLTPAEHRVKELVARGYSNKQIGTALDVKECTVKMHVRMLFKKLGVQNRIAIALIHHHLPNEADQTNSLEKDAA